MISTYSKSVSSIAACILDYLSENPENYYQLDDLCKVVASYVGIANPTRIKVVLLTLIEAGRIEGSTRRGKPSWMKHRPYVNPNGELVPREDYVRLRNSLDEANNEMNSLLTRVKEAEEKAPVDRIVSVQVMKGKKKVKVLEDVFHENFEGILQLAQARMNIFIYGPTGSGKSHICSQIAKSLDLPFYFVSCTSGMSEGVLGGRLLPTGDAGKFEYTVSEFIKAYENGGVFLLDEIDAADPNVLLLVNAALANGQVAVPNRPEKPYAQRHEDFICVAAANTVGTGADRLYSGRNKLDAATLDRFQIGKVLMTYSDEVEKQLCPDDELRAHLLKYREAINVNRLERAMSTRFMKDAYKMKSEFGWDHNKIDEAFFSGWREDEIHKVRGYAV